MNMTVISSIRKPLWTPVLCDWQASRRSQSLVPLREYKSESEFPLDDIPSIVIITVFIFNSGLHSFYPYNNKTSAEAEVLHLSYLIILKKNAAIIPYRPSWR